jgi:L-lactate dehydrogenase complex protein LldF
VTTVYGDDAQLGARVHAALADEQLGRNLAATRQGILAGRDETERAHPDWQDRVARARAIRLDSIDRMDELCRRFAERFEANGGRVLRAATAAEATRMVTQIARRRQATLAAKGKSMVSEEIGLNEALAAAGVEPVETDLGEWIVQLAGEHPSHILAPVVHRSRRQIADVLEEEAGTALDDDPEGLVAHARGRLRDTFLAAGIGITGANFLVAESGTAIVLENEGNGRLVSSLPRCHVVVTGIEKVVERVEDAAFLTGQLSLAAIARELPSYVSWISGPARDGDDGPDEVVCVLVDNGRSRVAAGPDAEALLCVRCGACLSVCPVYERVGGHAYGSVYPGPIGAVLTPQLEEMRAGKGRALPFMSSLCGACSDICPVGVPLADLLVRGRAEANAAGQSSRAERLAWHAWARAWSSPAAYRASARLGSRTGPLARAFGPGAAWAHGRGAPPLPDRRPFHARWQGP